MNFECNSDKKMTMSKSIKVNVLRLIYAATKKILLEIYLTETYA